ncbi:hypothetical protein BJ742DRAFT_854857 [Cladochytrium replicatum]|nr:hypothetical protein BJ742DRAFT_854857 [Cladochytrium replicatum]
MDQPASESTNAPSPTVSASSPNAPVQTAGSPSVGAPLVHTIAIVIMSFGIYETAFTLALLARHWRKRFSAIYCLAATGTFFHVITLTLYVLLVTAVITYPNTSVNMAAAVSMIYVFSSWVQIIILIVGLIRFRNVYSPIYYNSASTIIAAPASTLQKQPQKNSLFRAFGTSATTDQSISPPRTSLFRPILTALVLIAILWLLIAGVFAVVATFTRDLSSSLRGVVQLIAAVVVLYSCILDVALSITFMRALSNGLNLSASAVRRLALSTDAWRLVVTMILAIVFAVAQILLGVTLLIPSDSGNSLRTSLGFVNFLPGWIYIFSLHTFVRLSYTTTRNVLVKNSIGMSGRPTPFVESTSTHKGKRGRSASEERRGRRLSNPSSMQERSRSGGGLRPTVVQREEPIRPRPEVSVGTTSEEAIQMVGFVSAVMKSAETGRGVRGSAEGVGSSTSTGRSDRGAYGYEETVAAILDPSASLAKWELRHRPSDGSERGREWLNRRAAGGSEGNGDLSAVGSPEIKTNPLKGFQRIEHPLGGVSYMPISMLAMINASRNAGSGIGSPSKRASTLGSASSPLSPVSSVETRVNVDRGSARRARPKSTGTLGTFASVPWGNEETSMSDMLRYGRSH